MAPKVCIRNHVFNMTLPNLCNPRRIHHTGNPFNLLNIDRCCVETVIDLTQNCISVSHVAWCYIFCSFDKTFHWKTLAIYSMIRGDVPESLQTILDIKFISTILFQTVSSMWFVKPNAKRYVFCHLHNLDSLLIYHIFWLICQCN